MNKTWRKEEEHVCSSQNAEVERLRGRVPRRGSVGLGNIQSSTVNKARTDGKG